jgi:hypothetical protein
MEHGRPARAKAANLSLREGRHPEPLMSPRKIQEGSIPDVLHLTENLLHQSNRFCIIR